MFLAMKVHNQKVSCPYDGPSRSETCRMAFTKLNYNKMHLVGFMCNNCITMRGFNNVKITPNVTFVFSHTRWHICIFISDGLEDYL
jgi:hypothetical protein